MKIAFFEIQDWEIDHLKKSLSKHTLRFFKEPLNQDNSKQVIDYDILSVFIYSKLTDKLIREFTNLKLIVTRSTGFDHIDLIQSNRKKVTVCNVPFYGENTVAEHTFALILSLSRKIHKAYLKAMAGDFSIDELKGFDLKGKTLGVIGAGHIGRNVIRMANGFQMKVIVYDRHRDSKLSKELKFTYSSINDLLKKSDIITLHLPLFKETFHIINKNNIKLVKKEAIIINTARGELIDNSAILSALEKNKIAGLGLDVIEGESLIKEERQILHNGSRKELKKLTDELNIIRNDKVVYTPHSAFYSQEALERILHTTIENIQSFINKKPVNTVKCTI